MPISPGSMHVPVSRAKTWQKVPAPCRLVPRSQPLALKITRGPSGNRRWPFRRGQHSRSLSWNLALSTTYVRRALQACLRSLPRAGPKWRTSLRSSPLPPPWSCRSRLPISLISRSRKFPRTRPTISARGGRSTDPCRRAGSWCERGGTTAPRTVKASSTRTMTATPRAHCRMRPVDHRRSPLVRYWRGNSGHRCRRHV